MATMASPTMPDAARDGRTITISEATGGYLLRALLDSHRLRGRSRNPTVERWATELRQTLRAHLSPVTVGLVEAQVDALARGTDQPA